MSKTFANPKQTPRELGYRMPAEWEPHEATWIAWPHNPTDWPGKFETIPWVYAEIIRHLVTGERVHILVNDAAHRASARKVLRLAHVDMTEVSFHILPTDRVWTRDSGAIFVCSKVRGKRALGAIDWQFNGWAKYSDWRKDERVGGYMAWVAGPQQFWQPVTQVKGKSVRVVLEGGSIDVNGQGTLLATEECLLSKVQQRNPGVTRKQYEEVFADYLGATNVIWLKRGIAGDDTHGHVDDLARFVSSDTVMLAYEVDRRDANHVPLRENLQTLTNAKTESGKRIKVKTLPMPAPVIFRRQRLPASYANFYIANKVVLVPTFNDPNDRIALNTISEVFPDRKVVGIHCLDFIWGLGAIHCMTQQQPAVR